MLNKLKICLFLLLAGILFSAVPAFAGQPGGRLRTELYFDSRIGKYVEVAASQVLVKFKPSVSAQSVAALNAAHGTTVVSQLSALGVYKLSGAASVEGLVRAYSADPSVEYAEPNFIYVPMSTTPDDPYFSQQWGLTNIKAPQTWDIQKGTSEVIIAVVDSGLDLSHEDLQNRVYTGFRWNYNDSNTDVTDLYGHGTHVAGIIGAETNNGIGVAGVTWDCKIMILKVFDVNGTGDTMDILSNAVMDAANHHAKVINMSLGGTSFSSTFNSALQTVHGQGCVLVASAGNEGDSTIKYPASYDNVISVAAVDRYDVRASYSNYNAYVDVSAPGGQGSLHSSNRVLSTLPSYHFTLQNDGYYNNYDSLQGTSMSTPFVSGFAGLIFSQHPTWAPASVEALIFSSVDHLGSGAAGTRNDQYGYGRINMYKAFDVGPPAPPSAPAAQQNRNQVSLNWTASTQSNLERYLIYRSSAQAGPYTLTASVDATQTSYTDTVTQEGAYYYKVSALDAAGLESALTAATAVTVAFTLADVYVYPNPVLLVPSAEVVFGGLKGNETIRLYTMTGEFITSTRLQGAVQWQWNARNAAGKAVAPGIYLYLLSNPAGDKRVGKIAAIGKI